MKRDKKKAAKAPKRTAPGWSRLWKHALPVAALAGSLFLVYSNSLHAPLLLDNEDVILKDARIQTVSSVQLHRILEGQYWETAPTGLYRPLVTLSYLFNYSILGNGARPEGYHWINLILHTVNVILVYLLGLAIFEQIPPALLLAAVWGLHPLLTESVTNVVGRADLLAAFGVLAALLCHRQALRAEGARKAAWLAAIALAMTVGMFSKESAVVAVAVLAIYDFTYERAASWRSRVPSYAAVAVPCLAFLIIRARVLASSPLLGTQFPDNPLLGAGFWTARMTAVKVIGKYFLLWIWPANLSYDYSYNQVHLFQWNDWLAVLALIACVAAAVGALRSTRRHKPVFFAVAFFFVTLSPMSNLVIRIGAIMAERFLYLPTVGFAILAVYAFQALQRRRRQAAEAAAVILLIAASTRTWARNSDWLDPQRFWRSGVEAAPASYKTHLNLSNAAGLLTQADCDRSLREVERALAILEPLPDDRNAPAAYRNAGILYREIGERLASHGPTASAATGTSPEFWYRKSLDALLRSERIELAWNAQYRAENPKWSGRELTSVPGELYLALGRTYERLGDPARALDAFEKGHMLGSDPDLLEELASAYRSAGQPHKAALAMVEALAVDPSRTSLNGQLLELYQQIDPRGCSISHEGGSPSLNVDCPLVHGDICAASQNVENNYLRRGQTYEAGEIRRVATDQLNCPATEQRP